MQSNQRALSRIELYAIIEVILTLGNEEIRNKITKDGERRMENGGRRTESGEWRMENG